MMPRKKSTHGTKIPWGSCSLVSQILPGRCTHWTESATYRWRADLLCRTGTRVNLEPSHGDTGCGVRLTKRPHVVALHEESVPGRNIDCCIGSEPEDPEGQRWGEYTTGGSVSAEQRSCAPCRLTYSPAKESFDVRSAYEGHLVTMALKLVLEPAQNAAGRNSVRLVKSLWVPSHLHIECVEFVLRACRLHTGGEPLREKVGRQCARVRQPRDPGAAKEGPGNRHEDSRDDTANDTIHVDVVYLVAVGLGGGLLVQEAWGYSHVRRPTWVGGSSATLTIHHDKHECKERQMQRRSPQNKADESVPRILFRMQALDRVLQKISSAAVKKACY